MMQASSSPPQHDGIAPDRMKLVDSWRELPLPTELYVDDQAGDGHLVGAGVGGQTLCAVIGHAGGVLHTVTWQRHAAAWSDARRDIVKSRIRAALSRREPGRT